MSPTLAPVEIPDAAPMEALGQATIERARELVKITDQASCDRAQAELQRIKDGRQSVIDAFAPAAEATHRAHKEVTRLRGSLVAVFDQAELLLAPAVTGWIVAENRRLQAEQARLEAEAKARQDAAALAEAEEHEAGGDHEAAERVLEEAVSAPPPVVELPKAKPAPGLTMRTSWDFRIVRLSDVKDEYKVPNEVAIRKVVQALGQKAVGAVGGIEVFQVQTLARAARR